MPEVRVNLNPSPVPKAERDTLISRPRFGQAFTDHMVTMSFSNRHWGPMELTRFAPLALSPATLALHYGQSIFEALKAYRQADGSPTLFRPSRNAERMKQSAARIAMPELPDGAFELACALLVEADREWIPEVDGSALYVRPFMFASEPHLSVRPADDYQFVVIACPVASYFDSESSAIAVAVESRDVRAASGGTGAAKFAGNYAAGFAAHERASRAGYDQVMWLDAVEHRWVEELNAMNVMFVWNRAGRVVLTTPPLTGTILGGVTRDSLLQLASDDLATSSTPLLDSAIEEPTSIEMIRAGARDGGLLEAFACGTAAVIAPIGSLIENGHRLSVGSGTPGQVTLELQRRLLDIQHGRGSDPHGWMTAASSLLADAGIPPESLHTAD